MDIRLRRPRERDICFLLFNTRRAKIKTRSSRWTKINKKQDTRASLLVYSSSLRVVAQLNSDPWSFHVYFHFFSHPRRCPSPLFLFSLARFINETLFTPDILRPFILFYKRQTPPFFSFAFSFSCFCFRIDKISVHTFIFHWSYGRRRRGHGGRNHGRRSVRRQSACRQRRLAPKTRYLTNANYSFTLYLRFSNDRNFVCLFFYRFSFFPTKNYFVFVLFSRVVCFDGK